MSRLPLVTIALLTYNRCATLPRALGSARAQDYPNLEILVLDNASSDGTEALCRATAAEDARLRYVRHERNRGAIGNFNAALPLARGEYFMWLADDDWISPGYVSACVTLLEDDRSLALAAGRAEFPDEPAERRRPPPIEARDADAEARVLRYLSEPRDNSVFYGVYRTDLVRRAGMRAMLAGDWLTVAMVASQGKIVTTEAATVFRSSGGASRSHRHGARALGLPLWHGWWPKIVIATDIAGALFRELPYDNVDARTRRRLAMHAFCVLAARKRMLSWLRYLVPREQRPPKRRRRL